MHLQKYLRYKKKLILLMKPKTTQSKDLASKMLERHLIFFFVWGIRKFNKWLERLLSGCGVHALIVQDTRSFPGIHIRQLNCL